ncbi:hypothetical protein EGV01_29190 [Pseudomonas syringae pv. theae]|nr:hypothetical protein [Pseudomonas syringae pv. theae]MBL3833739.1 hypothetical protein [Pseudomonas syringae pv. theae]MBL3875914.1 hypothetical protein [Pseudomonas syringae pv. theae]
MASMRKIELKRIIRDCGRAEGEWQLASVGRLTADSGRRPKAVGADRATLTLVAAHSSLHKPNGNPPIGPGSLFENPT